MRKYFFIVLFISNIDVSFAQRVTDVINAEKAFALYALEHNTRDAFLKHMDTGAVVFDKGQVLNGRKVWTANTPSSSKLLWKPAFAGISLSGNLGFSTGPWEYKTSLADTAIAVGQFATIWHKTAAGEWKFLVDLGVSFNKPVYTVTKIQVLEKGRTGKADTGVLLRLESSINDAYKIKGPAAILTAVDNHAWLITKNALPLQGIDSIRKNAAAILPVNITFKFATGNVSPAGDMAYAYGYVMYSDKQENYLRIWQRTNKGWKIVLMLVQ